MSIKQAVIVGGGFAGLQVAKHLGDCAGVDITLLDRNNHYVFQPMLYQVATAALSPTDIACPIRKILSRYKNIMVLQAEATQLDIEKRLVTTDSLQLPYDYLVVATGMKNNYYGHDSWRPLAPGLKTIFDAVTIRNRLLTAFERAERELSHERQRQLLTFVIIGGGYTGVELAGAVAELARYSLAREFKRIRPEHARIILVEAGPRILPGMPESLAAYAHSVLVSLKVEIMAGTPVSSMSEECVTVGEQDIASSTMLWAAGVRASSLGGMLGVQTDRQGRVPVNFDLSIVGHPEVFVAGDLAHFQGRNKAPLPGLGPVAVQEGRHVAKIIRLDMRDKPRKPFHYWNKGELAAIGRNRAVGLIGSMAVRGLPAWLVWVFVHIYYLSDFRNRLIVILQWAWTYLAHSRGARLIMRNDQSSNAG